MAKKTRRNKTLGKKTGRPKTSPRKSAGKNRTSRNRIIGGTSQVAFQYVPAAKTLVRKFNGVQTDLFLKQCDCLRFDIYQNDGTNTAFEALSPATTNNCKVVQVNWRLSRGLAGVAASTEDFQSARIVMRKQGS